MKQTPLNFFYAVIIMTVSISAYAENTPLDRAQIMLRQINAQKVQLEQQNAQLKAELEKLNKDTEKQLKKQKAGNDKLGQMNKEMDEHLQRLRSKLKATITALRKSETERLSANNMGEALDKDLKRCVKNNHELVLMNDVLVGKYQDKGIWDALSQREPFTGIKQVELENMMQEYRFSNEDLKVNPEVEYKTAGDVVSSAPEEGDNGS